MKINFPVKMNFAIGKIIRVLSALAVIFFAIAVYLMLSGPRMEYQYKIKTYESPFRPKVEGTIPVEAVLKMPADNAVNPVAMQQSNVQLGRVYYGYYCLFCHGQTGKGDGEVGQSYYPKPLDLHSGKLKSYSDSKLYRAMLTGVGHEPVLERVVLERYRWYLVLYMRSLQNSH